MNDLYEPNASTTFPSFPTQTMDFLMDLADAAMLEQKRVRCHFV